MTSTDRDAVRRHLVAWSPENAFHPLTRAVWRPEPVAAPSAVRSLAGLAVLVLGSSDELRDEVAGRLAAAGARILAEPEAARADGIVDLNLTGLRHHRGDRRWRAALARSVEALHAVHARWTAEPRCGQHFYLTVTAQDGLLGHGPAPEAPGVVVQPLGGIWAGLAKGLQYELPTVAVTTVDLDPASLTDPASAAAVVVAECAARDLLEVGHHGGTRRTLVGRPERAGAETVHLAADDTVLITGGGRGIGFALAEGLAARTGCRVVVTGRADLSVPEPAWELDDEGFARWRADELRATSDLRAARRRIGATAQHRDTYRNLLRARESGLRIDYATCDCTDAGQVEALVREVGPQTTVLVHNAGVDQSRRLADQTPDDVVRTVEVKVEGLLNLVDAFRALEHRRLAVVSGVGSLSGRLGGMIGQVAYSAANDALARLAPWVSGELGVAAQTTIWHSWGGAGGAGGLANPRTALRYTSLVEPADGVRHWVHEIVSGRSDEAVFMGRFGSAVQPTQVAGLRAAALGLADQARWASAHHWLGEIRSFRVHEELSSEVRLREGDHPALGEFTVDGEAALPVSVLTEYAMNLGDWVAPHGWPRMHLREVADLEVTLGALTFRSGELVIRQSASGAWRTADEWAVDVELRRGDGERMLSARLVYGALPAEPSAPAPVAELTELTEPADEARARWAGHLFRRPGYRPVDGGLLEAHPAVVTPADLWALPFPPEVGLAPVFLEELARHVLPATATHLRVGSLRPAPGARDVTTIRVADGGRTWAGLTAQGDVVVVADQVGATVTAQLEAAAAR